MSEEAVNAVLPIIQGQLEELRLELERRRKCCMELEDKNIELSSTIEELRKRMKALQEDVGSDIEAFYFKAAGVIRSQLGLTMLPGDLIRLWFNFSRLAERFTAESYGTTINKMLLYRFEQGAYELARRMYEKGEIQIPHDNLGDMLERIVYPYIIVDVGGEQLSWKELRERLT